MPYITKKRAEEIDGYDLLINILSLRIQSGGELNYVISRLLVARYEVLGPSYENLKSVSGDAVLAAEEFRRRRMIPYENEKMHGSMNADPYVSKK